MLKFARYNYITMNKLGNWLNKAINQNKEEINNTNLPIPKKKNFNFHNQNKNHKGKLRIIALGGLNEVGKNCLVFEYEDDIVVVDAGLQFPEEDMLGIDFVIPDFTYLEQRRKKIKALIITHGHLDHIGAVPHFLKKFSNVPVYATKLTNGLLQKRLDEYRVKSHLNEIDPSKDKLKIGSFNLSFFRVNHSIPDGMGIFIESPAGKVVHTGDFKFDFSPINGVKTDFHKLAEIGNQDIDILFSDSTNAQKKGFCISERVVAKNLEKVIKNAKGRLIIASFSSLIGRIQQIIDFAIANNRSVFVSGKSMIDNLEIAAKLGYVKVPRGVLKKISPKIDELPPNKVLILTTGSQGESMSALSRIALGNHQKIKIRKGDTVMFSSSPIPGNERSTANVVNNLFRLGAHVITKDAMDIHASGHAHQDDLKLMYSIIRPRFVAPIHGEFYMRMAHSEMLQNDFDLDESKIIILENGSISEVENHHARKSKEKASANLIMIDGLGVGDTSTTVIRDRQVMSENGVVVVLFRAFEKSKRLVGDPDVISRGFIYMKESKEIQQETKIEAKKAFESTINKNPNIDIKSLKNEVYKSLRTFIRKRLDREPMIMPLIVFV